MGADVVVVVPVEPINPVPVADEEIVTVTCDAFPALSVIVTMSEVAVRGAVYVLPLIVPESAE